jgi:predicted transcriptional regulator
MQLAWLNGAYRTFKDYEKFMIVMFLMMKTFDTYSKNLVMLNFDEFFDQNMVEIDTINISELSKNLNIPKETARRKIIELEELETVKRINKKIIIDRNTWPNIKPEDSIKRMSYFLSNLSNMCVEEGLISAPIKSERLVETSKKHFSLIWSLYYDMQMPMLLNHKKLYGDLETFHVCGTCISNDALHTKKADISKMSKELYLEKYFSSDSKHFTGVNAMSISDITGIPRATVIRKLNKLIKLKFLKIDNKKHYSSGGVHTKKLLAVQKIVFDRLSIFAARVYHLSSIK